MILHWSPRSPYVRKVLIAAHEKDLMCRIELVRAVALITDTNDQLMAINPLNKIPTLVTDDGEILFDSLVICEYFDALAPDPPAISEDPVQRRQILRNHALASGLTDLLILLRDENNRQDGLKSSIHITAYTAKIKATIDLFEQMAANLAVGDFTIDKIAIGCALSYADFRHDALSWRNRHPQLAEWHEMFEQRASSRATQIESGF